MNKTNSVLIYVAGPFRAKSSWDVEQNIRYAERVGYKIALLGATPVIPHSMYRFFDGTMPDSFWLNATMDILRRCDAIVMCRWWMYSKGAKAEFREANIIGMPVIYESDTDFLALVKLLVGGKNQ